MQERVGTAYRCLSSRNAAQTQIGQQQPEHVSCKWTKFHKYWSPMKSSLMFQLCEVNNTDDVENDANGSNKEHENTFHKNL